MNIQIFKLNLEKTEEREIKLPASVGSEKKRENFIKTSTSALLIMPKPWCESQQIMEILKRDENTRPAS